MKEGILIYRGEDTERWHIAVVQTSGGRVTSHYFHIGNRERGYASRFAAVACLWFLTARKRRYSPDEQNPYLTGERER